MKVRNESNTLSPAVIGVDIGKDVFHLVGFGVGGKIVFRRRIRRLGLKDTSRSCHHASSTWKPV
jgi:transposase